ncbi:hypothetical protein GCK32_022424 [Trichostrongylus colubriformis]|uniref:Uncharacterized protein n=1 Tax=Trichostrongylus colubriformis TaxID=6319 RepID=A0AAN8ENA4_TRICO
MSSTSTVDFELRSHHLGCNCQYPMILLGFVILAIAALFACVCICCIDATKCSPFKTSRKSAWLKSAPLRDANKFIEQKVSDGRKFAHILMLMYIDSLLENCGVPLN